MSIAIALIISFVCFVISFATTEMEGWIGDAGSVLGILGMVVLAMGALAW